MDQSRKQMVLLLTNAQNGCCRFAEEIVRQHFPSCRIVSLKGRQAAAHKVVYAELAMARYALVISFLCPTLVPRELLDQAELAVNFHTGDANYPGIGCVNFALYEGVRDFGVVCHEMDQYADAGDIIVEEKFPVFETDNVDSLTFRAYIALFGVLQTFLSAYLSEDGLPKARKKWTRKAFTRKDLNALALVDLSMDAEEIQKRVRATQFPGWPTKFQVGDAVFDITDGSTMALSRQFFPAEPRG